MRLSRRVEEVAVASTSRMRTLAQELRRAGRPVANLAAGELEQAPPEALVAALTAAAHDGRNCYTDTAGDAQLRRALAADHAVRVGTSVTEQNAIVTVGAKHALYLTALALLEPGDEVLIPSPSWVTFPAQVTLAGARPVAVDTVGTGFQLTTAQLEAHRSNRTRAVILNSPNNPTGAVYGREQIEDIARWALQHDIVLVFDESYGRLTFSGQQHWHPAELVPQVQDAVVTIGSFSKTFAVAGWRAGYAIAPAPVVAAMKKFQAHTTSNATSVVQAAMLRALQEDLEPYVRRSAAALERRWSLVEQALAGAPDVSVVPPQGGFFALLDCTKVLHRRTPDGSVLSDSTELAEFLLSHAGVATVPGQAFGAPGHLRLSFARGDDEVLTGVAHLLKAFGELNGG